MRFFHSFRNTKYNLKQHVSMNVHYYRVNEVDVLKIDVMPCICTLALWTFPQIWAYKISQVQRLLLQGLYTRNPQIVQEKLITSMEIKTSCISPNNYYLTVFWKIFVVVQVFNKSCKEQHWGNLASCFEPLKWKCPFCKFMLMGGRWGSTAQEWSCLQDKHNRSK